MTRRIVPIEPDVPKAALALLTAICAVVASGCDRNSPAVRNTSEDDSQVLRSEIERGPVRVSLEIEPKEPRLSDEPTLTLTIETESGVDVAKPPFGAALGEFTIRDFREPLPTFEDNRHVMRQVYTLEPVRAGRLTIEPIAITFTDSRDDGDGEEHTIETEPMAVEVTTMLDTDAPSLDDLRAATGPVELPAEPSFAAWWIFGGVVAIAAIALMLVLRRRRVAAVEPELTPKERAYLELQSLIDTRLAETDVKQYYVELTGIVRRFIERSTDVRAPEQTTDEFLRAIAGDVRFSATERDRLQSFLEAADLVKYAAHRPTAADLEHSFERAKHFLGLDAGTGQEVAA